MKKWTRLLAAILTLTLCLVFGGLLLNCMRPMEDRAYDLSLMSWEGEGMPEGWVYDQKGWTVFTQEGEAVTELAPDGFGGFDRLDELGQTFYFSRVLSEDADSPTLRLDATISSVAVFLDGALIYTDCPELNNRIGDLRLPKVEVFRHDMVLPDRFLCSLYHRFPGAQGGFALRPFCPSGKDKFSINDFRCSVTDVIHTPHPFHLIFNFKLLRNAFLFRQLFH